MLRRIASVVACLWCISTTVFAADCTTIKTQVPPRVDMQIVRDTWLGWVNDARKEKGLAPYTLDDTLNHTAGNWAFYSAKRGSIDHKRAIGAPYYDYKAIEKWFDHFGVTFTNIAGKTFTENIGWGVYKCKGDCTTSLTKSIRSTFDFYMGEKQKQDRPHYNSIMNPQFTKIGIGIAVDRRGKYFIAVHYGTQVKLAKDFCESAR